MHLQCVLLAAVFLAVGHAAAIKHYDPVALDSERQLPQDEIADETDKQHDRSKRGLDFLEALTAGTLDHVGNVVRAGFGDARRIGTTVFAGEFGPARLQVSQGYQGYGQPVIYVQRSAYVQPPVYAQPPQYAQNLVFAEYQGFAPYQGYAQFPGSPEFQRYAPSQRYAQFPGSSQSQRGAPTQGYAQFPGLSELQGYAQFPGSSELQGYAQFPGSPQSQRGAPTQVHQESQTNAQHEGAVRLEGSSETAGDDGSEADVGNEIEGKIEVV